MLLIEQTHPSELVLNGARQSLVGRPELAVEVFGEGEIVRVLGRRQIEPDGERQGARMRFWVGEKCYGEQVHRCDRIVGNVLGHASMARQLSNDIGHLVTQQIGSNDDEVLSSPFLKQGLDRS